jgi:heterotetrameric sarcosine oxidase beta subunit
MYSERGQLTLAHTDATVRSFRQRAEVNKHFGGRTEMIDRQQIRELVPSLNLDPGHLPVLAGLWHIDGATARHDAVAWGYAKQAAKRGVEIHQLTEVQDLVIENGAITAVKTNRGTIQCGCAVQAIAGHSSLLMAKAGIRSPIQTFPLQAMVTQPFKPFLDPLVSSSALHCYVQQTSRGEVVFGGGSDPYPLFNTRSTLDLKESLLAHAIEMFPFLANAKLMRQWAGITDMTPDYSPIMGLSPVKNYYLDAGWGTWGFKATPICGKTMAELVASGGKVPELIKPFGLERFRPSSKSTKWAPRRPATDGARHENHDLPAQRAAQYQRIHLRRRVQAHARSRPAAMPNGPTTCSTATTSPGWCANGGCTRRPATGFWPSATPSAMKSCAPSTPKNCSPPASTSRRQGDRRMNRLPAPMGLLIDRDQPLDFSFDGSAIRACR